MPKIIVIGRLLLKLLTCFLLGHSVVKMSTGGWLVTVISSIRQRSAGDAARKHVCLVGDSMRRNKPAVRLHHNVQYAMTPTQTITRFVHKYGHSYMQLVGNLHQVKCLNLCD